MNYFRENIEQTEGYEPGFQPEKTDVVKLNTNENPYPPSPAALKAIAEIEAEQLRRYPDPLGDIFRKAASELHNIPQEYIMCCNGGDELLTIAFRAFCDQDHPVSYPVPTYLLYSVLAKFQGCKAIEVPFDSEFNLPARLAKNKAALTIVCNPNAPSGTLISCDELASLADELNGVLLIDEAYVDFAENSCLGLVRDLGNIVLVRSMSKGYSLAGLRFGYAIAQADLITGLIKVKDSYNVDAIALAAATASIKDQEYYRENINKIKTERAKLTEQLRQLGFKVPQSHANFVLAEMERAGTIYEKLAEQDIYVRYFPTAGLQDKLRITVGTDLQNEILIAAIKKILR